MNDQRIPAKILRELSDSEMSLRATMAAIAGEERRQNPSITDDALSDRIAQKCLFTDCDSWVEAMRKIREAGPSLRLDSN